MTALTFTDAKNRVVVRLPDGRSARLVCLPGGDSAHRSAGGKARVQLPSGAYLSVPAGDLERVECD